MNESRALLNKVPEVTVYFWIIKIMATAVGETAADFLNMNLGLGLTTTSAVMAVLLGVVLVRQLRSVRYVPWTYWLTVVLISVVGTLITDNLSDNLGVPLGVTTVVFGVALLGAFCVWYAREKTLSIHSIVTRGREGFYWLAILLTFALGTAAGDLTAERLNVGYLLSGLLIASLIVIVCCAHFVFGLNAVLAFWIAYVLTQPLGASFGDLLSQDPSHGGLGLGTTVLNLVFLMVIAGLVTYLSISRRVQLPHGEHVVAHFPEQPGLDSSLHLSGPDAWLDKPWLDTDR